MTVTELIEALSALPGDLIVFSQEDDEGNGYKRVNGVELGFTEDVDDYSPEFIHSEEYLLEDNDDPDNYDKVVVIY